MMKLSSKNIISLIPYFDFKSFISSIMFSGDLGLHPFPIRFSRSSKEVIAEVAARVEKDPITALSISSFGEAIVPVSKDRKILDDSILCDDGRGEEHIDRLLGAFSHEYLPFGS